MLQPLAVVRLVAHRHAIGSTPLRCVFPIRLADHRAQHASRTRLVDARAAKLRPDLLEDPVESGRYVFVLLEGHAERHIQTGSREPAYEQ